MFLVRHIWWIDPGSDSGVLHPDVVRFQFWLFMPLGECITMHYSHPHGFLVILYPPILQFLNEFLLDITVGPGSLRSHHCEHLDMDGITLTGINCQFMWPTFALKSLVPM